MKKPNTLETQPAEKAADPTPAPLAKTALSPNPICGLQRGYFICNERPGHKGGHKTWESGRIVFAWPR